MSRKYLLFALLTPLVALIALAFIEMIYLPSTNIPQLAPAPTPDAAGQRVKLPSGFHINIFAENLTNPRVMAFGSDGALYVSEMSAGNIKRLQDSNSDGLAESVTTAASGLSLPHGIEWHKGWLYVAESDRVEKLQDENNDGVFENRLLVTDNIPAAKGHNSRTLHFGPDGKLYVSVGSSCNVCVEDDPRRAAILRFNEDGSIPADNPYANDLDERKHPLWAWGLRNSVDFLWTPTGSLWADHNGSDGLGDDAPPEEVIISVQRNANHGWPYCYTPIMGKNLPPGQTREVADSRILTPNNFSCLMSIPALFTDLAHSAPLGMTLGTGAKFPIAFQDDLYIAYHGSWNTTADNVRDCKVQRIVIEKGDPIASVDFASGWRAEGKTCDDPESWGRPADVIIGPDGNMYISDDKGGRIYRVVYNG